MKPSSLSELANVVVSQRPELARVRRVIENELIHYDLLFLFQNKRVLPPDHTFIGGSCLRYCHGSTRYSEDLDFHVGANFDNKKFDKLLIEAERYIRKRYGLEVETRSPKQFDGDSNFSGHLALTWKIIVYTHGGRGRTDSQRIHIDVAKFPTYDVEYRLVQAHYGVLPDGYNTMLYKSSSETEILADKLVAVPHRKRIKARDLWDIVWLLQRRTPVNTELIRLKIADHHIPDFKRLLERRIETLSDYFDNGEYEKEMSRFLNEHDYKKTVKRQEFIGVLCKLIVETLTDLHYSLYSTSKT